MYGIFAQILPSNLGKYTSLMDPIWVTTTGARGPLLGGSSHLGYVVNNHGGRKSPFSRVIPIPNGLFMAYRWGLLTTYKSWDDPPSALLVKGGLLYQRRLVAKL